MFTQGAPKGPRLLLQKLRGERIDWKSIEAHMVPKKRCHGCAAHKSQEEYSVDEWKAKTEVWCRTCVQEKEEQETPLKCARCLEWRAISAYNSRALKCRAKRFCVECRGKETRTCCQCQRNLVEPVFATSWEQEDGVRQCRHCSAKGETGQKSNEEKESTKRMQR